MAPRLYLPEGREDKHASIKREILSVRNKVGLLDASTLGKIEIKGPDAAGPSSTACTPTCSRRSKPASAATG
jgi:glycine cleavage system aminomethyltransferase T